MPDRIQRKRVKGWRMPPGTIYVGRPSKWGNPCRGKGTVYAVIAYKLWIDRTKNGDWLRGDGMLGEGAFPLDHLDELRGKNLACWCPLDRPCHADVLLELANA